ncbi:MAG: hypothetical protein ABJA35_01480, partial [Parafilimonas sp.]
MQYFKTTTTLLCFCFAIVPVFSQTDSLVFQPVNNPLLQQYNIRHINTGSDGKLWLSTDNGLLCYDGNDVKIFKHEDGVAFTLSSNNVLKTYTDSKGNLFVLESPQIIDYLDVKTGRANQIDLLWKGEDLRIMGLTDYPELFIDDESIWIAKYYVGFSEYNMRTMKTNTYYYHDEYSGKNTVYTIKKDEHNKNLFWLGTDNGIYSFNKSTKKIERNFHCSNRSDSSIADLKINHLDVMNGDTIWFTVPAKGFGCYAIKTGLYTMYPFMNENEKGAMEGIDIFEIKRKSQNEYLIGTENNLPGIFNTVTHQYNFKVFTSQNLPAVLLNHFIVDSAGNFWCALYNRLYVAHSTLDKFSTVVLYNYSKQNKKVNFFKNIVWDSSRKLYYAAFEKSNGIFVLDSNLHFLKIIPIDNRENENKQSSIYDLGIDKQNRLWVCGNAVYIYDTSSQKLVTSNKIYSKLLFKEQQFQNLQFRGNYMFLQPSNQECRAIYRVNLLHMDYDSIPLPKEMINDNANGNYQPVRRLDYLVMDKEGKNTYWGYFRKSFFGYIDGIIQYNIETLKA